MRANVFWRYSSVEYSIWIIYLKKSPLTLTNAVLITIVYSPNLIIRISLNRSICSIWQKRRTPTKSNTVSTMEEKGSIFSLTKSPFVHSLAKFRGFSKSSKAFFMELNNASNLFSSEHYTTLPRTMHVELDDWMIVICATIHVNITVIDFFCVLFSSQIQCLLIYHFIFSMAKINCCAFFPPRHAMASFNLLMDSICFHFVFFSIEICTFNL